MFLTRECHIQRNLRAFRCVSFMTGFLKLCVYQQSILKLINVMVKTLDIKEEMFDTQTWQTEAVYQNTSTPIEAPWASKDASDGVDTSLTMSLVAS